MPRKPEEARNSEQRKRQQELRDADRKAKRPGRDDIARVALLLDDFQHVGQGDVSGVGGVSGPDRHHAVRAGFRNPRERGRARRTRPQIQ